MNGNYLEGRKDYDKLDDQAEFAILKRKYFHNLTKKKTNIQRYNIIIIQQKTVWRCGLYFFLSLFLACHLGLSFLHNTFFAIFVYIIFNTCGFFNYFA